MFFSFLFYTTASYGSPCSSGQKYLAQFNSCVELEWDDTPHLYTKSNSSEGRARLIFRDPATQKEQWVGKKIKAHLWMSLCETGKPHGSSPIKITTETNIFGNLKVGRFVLSKIYFLMNGVWELHVNVSDENTTEEVIFHQFI